MNWLASLTSPQDGMWESFRERGTHIAIKKEEKVIGYASIGEDNLLLQFYIKPSYLGQQVELFQRFMQAYEIKKAMVGTNNPIFLSTALHFAQKLEVHTYLFREHYEADISEREGELKKCFPDDLDKMVDFAQRCFGASRDWLIGYYTDLIGKGEVFSCENQGAIMGACEVRRSKTNSDIVDIGMMVAPEFRKQGYGTFLIHKAKTIALDWGKTPICSCEKDNVGSFKSITNAGFVSRYQLLLVAFD